MSTASKKDILKSVRQRKYLNKDFDGFRADLLEYARIHFPNNIKDFSETSLGGLLLDFAAYVGDVDSFYLDHMFHELNPETAREVANIENHLRQAGVDIVGASPAVVEQTFYVEIPAARDVLTGELVPSPVALPVVLAGSVVQSGNGTQFELVEDIDFSETNKAGKLVCNIAVGRTNANSEPTTFILSNPPELNKGICISGFRTEESISVGSFEQFKRHTLGRENVTEIISVNDNLGNEYYQVGHLTQDSIFQAILNKNEDNELVKDSLAIVPAPYRFISEMQLNTRLTILTFGGGSAQSLDDDIVPDPSEFAIPLYGKRNFSRFTLNPNNLLRSTTLGVIAPNSLITVAFRHGGGLTHNVGPRTIRNISTLLMSFPGNPTAEVSQFIRASIDTVNQTESSGGEDAPSSDELKLRIPAVKAAQSRIASREDLLARIYTMPANFGRVFRASVRPSANNPLASNVFIISRNRNSQLIVSPDSLKKNLSTYLNKYRMSNDAIDILDARVINFVVYFSITAQPGLNKNLVKQNIISKLKTYFNIKNFEIDQPVYLNDIENIIFNTAGVATISDLRIENIYGQISSAGDEKNAAIRMYSDVQYDIKTNTENRILFTPPGGIFELRFPEFDIKGSII
jgi:hypothetical protein